MWCPASRVNTLDVMTGRGNPVEQKQQVAWGAVATPEGQATSADLPHRNQAVCSSHRQEEAFVGVSVGCLLHGKPQAAALVSLLPKVTASDRHRGNCR